MPESESLRAAWRRMHPDFPWLDAGEPRGVYAFLVARGWLPAGEAMVGCERAGEGNMNLTLRVWTAKRSVVLKQARPWVEKYDHIPAPWDRTLAEVYFYERVGEIPAVAAHVPRLLGADAGAHAILLEDVPGARDLVRLYTGSLLLPDSAHRLGAVLRALHDGTAGDPPRPDFNADMRRLNHEHCFRVPLDPANGLDLDRYEPGLTGAARRLAADAAYRTAVDALAERYATAGGALVHGDYFPGSWLNTAVGLRIIDPEFCIRGDREIDVGCAIAHLVLARQPSDAVEAFLRGYAESGDDGDADHARVARYAAVEVMRRLIGVAQLPIPPSHGWRAALLARAREAMVRGTLAPLRDGAGP